jgi:hypothetical protein
MPVLLGDTGISGIRGVKNAKSYSRISLDDDILYKFQVDPENILYVANRMGLKEADNKSFRKEILRSWNEPPYWWDPKRHDNVKYFVGLNKYMICDLKSKTAYMHEWSF